MTDMFLTFIIAMGSFTGTHFILSSMTMRTFLIGKLGDGGFRGLYSLVAAGTLIWALFSYGDVRYDSPLLWQAATVLNLIAIAILPVACILVVCALSSMGKSSTVEEDPALPQAPKGIFTITRHPLMVGIALWAASHLIVNGDLASVILFTGFLILTIGGMIHIDHRRQLTMGSNWGPIALTTSTIPFLAALQGRTSIDWKGIGVIRILAGLVLYLLISTFHQWIAGVPVTLDRI